MIVESIKDKIREILIYPVVQIGRYNLLDRYTSVAYTFNKNELFVQIGRDGITYFERYFCYEKGILLI